MVGCLVAALIVLRVVGLDPRGHWPGLWLRGKVVTTPVSDWSFTDKYETIFVETHSWYGLPHSVTVFCASYGGRLYVGSSYHPGVEFPRDRLWNKNFVRDPRVRLKIGTQIYERTLRQVTDATEKDAVLAAYARKYRRAGGDKDRIRVFRVEPA